MEDLENAIATAIRRAPWNKGKLTGGKASAPPEACLVDPNETSN
jgi:hypothetical protein